MDTTEDAPTLPVVVCSAAVAATTGDELRRLPARLRVVDRGELIALVDAAGPELALVILLDDALAGEAAGPALPDRARSLGALRVVSLTSWPIAADASVADAKLCAELGPSASALAIFRAARGGLREVAYEARHRRLEAEVKLRAAQIHELNRIGVALSTERNQERLLVRILSALRDLTDADAGSLYLVEQAPGGPRVLRFTVAQNDSIPTPALVRFTLPIEPKTLAGYAAWSGQPLLIPDVYAIPTEAQYSFSKAFDEKTGYRTRSMLVMPMKNQAGEIIGVVQLINKRGSRERLPDPPHLCRDIIPFDELAVELATSLTSQAAVCIENNALYEGLRTNIQELKDTQSQLVQSEKLASLGQLTAGVAHEINNPLAFTRNNTHLAIERIASASRRLAVKAWLDTRDDDPFDRLDAGEAILQRLAEDSALQGDVQARLQVGCVHAYGSAGLDGAEAASEQRQAGGVGTAAGDDVDHGADGIVAVEHVAAAVLHLDAFDARQGNGRPGVDRARVRGIQAPAVEQDQDVAVAGLAVAARVEFDGAGAGAVQAAHVQAGAAFQQFGQGQRAGGLDLLALDDAYLRRLHHCRLDEALGGDGDFIKDVDRVGRGTSGTDGGQDQAGEGEETHDDSISANPPFATVVR